MAIPFTIAFRQIQPDSEEALRNPRTWAWLKRVCCGVEITATVSLMQLTEVYKPLPDSEPIKLALIKAYMEHRERTNPTSLFQSLEYWFGYKVDPSNLVEVKAAYRFLAGIDYENLRPFLHPLRARRVVREALDGLELKPGFRLNMSPSTLRRVEQAVSKIRKAFSLNSLEFKKSPGRPPRHKPNG